MYQRKDGTWVEKIYLPNGKVKYIYGKSRQEVKQKLVEWKGDIEKGPTVSEALDEWLDARWELVQKKKLAYKTYEGYKAPVKRIKGVLGELRLNEVTPAHVDSFISDIADKGYKRTTVQRPLDVLNMVYKFYITKAGTSIKSNPCSSVDLPSGLKQDNRDLISRADAEIVRTSLHIDFGLFAFLIMYSGLREGEVLALTDSDFYFKEEYIDVCKEVSWQTNKPVIKKPKTENSIRKVILLSVVVDALPMKNGKPAWKGYLFSADGGKTPLTQTQFRHRWNGYCRAAGLADSHIEEHKVKTKSNLRNQEGKEIEKTYKKTVWKNRIVPHQLRHEFASLCLDAGLEPIDTKDQLGHASVETTMKIYTHIKESRREKTASKLKNFVLSAEKV